MGLPAARAALPSHVAGFLDQHCSQCHDAASKKGGLDLDALSFDLKDPKVFAEWTVRFEPRAARYVRLRADAETMLHFAGVTIR